MSDHKFMWSELTQLTSSQPSHESSTYPDEFSKCLVYGNMAQGQAKLRTFKILYVHIEKVIK